MTEDQLLIVRTAEYATNPVLNFIVSGKQMGQIEPALFATLKQDAAILRSTRAFYRKGGSSQLYCHELLGG